MTNLSEDDLVQLRRIHAGGRNAVMADDVARWRACGWLEPEPSWKLTPQGLRALNVSELLADLNPPLLKDPGPNHPEPPPIRRRSPAELQPVREALMALSSALLRLTHPVHRADGRLAWIHSILPLASPEEVGDAISFAGCVLRRMGEPDLWQNVTVEQETDVRRATLRALTALGTLVDDMREEAEGPPTDRRRSVACPEESREALIGRQHEEAHKFPGEFVVMAGPLVFFHSTDREKAVAAYDLFATASPVLIEPDGREAPDRDPTVRGRSWRPVADRWEAVPIEEVDLLYEAARSVADYPFSAMGVHLQMKIDKLAAVVARIREVLDARAASSTP